MRRQEYHVDVKRREIEKNDEKWEIKRKNREIPPIFEWQVVENEEAAGKENLILSFVVIVRPARGRF